MFQFVYWLRAIAAVMITNSHYADIWPISAMAFGGHFGNCIYFFLSGFCLYNIQESFPRWYAKRIIRIYPALWIVAAVNLLTGFWNAGGIMAYVHCLLYPTWYHFITSIMLLYLVFYAVRAIQKRVKIDTLWFLLAAFLVYLAAYILHAINLTTILTTSARNGAGSNSWRLCCWVRFCAKDMAGSTSGSLH